MRGPNEPGAQPGTGGVFSPVELEIELFCRGVRVSEATFGALSARRIARTRAGLGSGLELVLPDPKGDVWVNAPVVERFAKESPFTLETAPSQDSGFAIHDERSGAMYPVRIPGEPAWYSRTTSQGTPMAQVGVLQGTYLGVFLSNACFYWHTKPEPTACRFCTSGKNVGVNEVRQKDVLDVVEVAAAARAESGAVFTHFNTGYQFEDDPARRAHHGLMRTLPFVSAVRERVGGFIGVQAVPVPWECFDEYDRVIDAGADHFSFCVELEDPEVFARICPGKAATVGQKAFYDALEYTAKKLGPGRVSGELIAGLEPIAETKRAIDRIVSLGGFPTVCIFRPLEGSNLEEALPPDPSEMRDVMAYQYEACRKAGIPIGVLPIDVSLVVQPEEGGRLTPRRPGLYEWKLALLKTLAKPYVAWKLRPSG